MRRHGNRHNGIQHNDTHHDDNDYHIGLFVILNINDTLRNRIEYLVP